MSGQILNQRYELGLRLGVGKFGKVYAARDLVTNSPVAIKAMDKSLIKKADLASKVLREIAILRRVRHPNIVRLLHVTSTPSHVFLVMELVPSGDLHARINALRRIPEPAARRYFQQLLSALAFCHARGVFHRDLKPENILLDDRDNVKVADFGLSALVERKQSNVLMTTVGTPAYVAPEVLGRRGYDGAKADVWSCGVLLYAMVAGRLPFRGTNVYEFYRILSYGQFRFPAWFGRELVDLLLGMLNLDSDARLSVGEIMEHVWFKIDYRPPVFYVEEDGELYLSGAEDNQDTGNKDSEASESDSGYDSDASASSTASCPANLPSMSGSKKFLLKPRSLNAFDIISGWRETFLSGILEEEPGGATRFLSKEPAEKIVSELQALADVVSYKVRTKDTYMILQSSEEGVETPLTIAAEVSYLTPEIVVLQVKRKAGNEEAYNEFLENVLKPNLKHLLESPLIKSSTKPK